MDPLVYLPTHAASLLLHGPRDVRWVMEALPPLGPDKVLIATRAGAISGGTELPLYRGDSRAATPPTYPRMSGYENVGVVLARGPAVREPAIGARVVATYGHRTHALVPAHKAYSIPDDIGDELALLLILSGDVLTGLRKLGTPPPGPALVTGAGAIGLLAVFGLAALGTPDIDVVEPLIARHELALALGARRVLTPQEATGLSADYASGVECSARDAAFATLQRTVRPHGRIGVLSDGNVETLTLTPHFHERQLAVLGSSDCPDYHAHARWYFPAARAVQMVLPRLFDHRVVAPDLPATFTRLAADRTLATKVFVSYDTAL